MRSRVGIVAELEHGRTVLRGLEAGGHFALRQGVPTGTEGIVRLVATAAGPLNGDVIDIRIEVGAGARLTVSGVAATIVLPGRRAEASILTVDATVADGGHLDLRPEPTVVCALAHHRTRIAVNLSDRATARITERVVLGRSGEPGGLWSGQISLLRNESPLLRQTTHSTALNQLGHRALITTVDIPTASRGGEASQVGAASGNAVAMPLAAGGTMVTATGADLSGAHTDLEALAAVEMSAA